MDAIKTGWIFFQNQVLGMKWLDELIENGLAAMGLDTANRWVGSARFFSGLCLSDFTKKNHIISYSKRALEKIRGPIERVAQLEGLQKHYESIKVRFDGPEKK